MKSLIVNADDFGLHTEINKGIINGYQEGFITSTSLMCSAPAFEDAVALARQNDGLGIGIHLTLVGSVPSVLPKEKITSLVNETIFTFILCLFEISTRVSNLLNSSPHIIIGLPFF